MIGLRCFVMTSGDGSLPASIEPSAAGMKAAAINKIGRREASSREYTSVVSMCAKKFVGSGSNPSAALKVWESEYSVELAPLRFIASSTETGLKPVIRSRLDKPTVGVIATRLAADCFEK